MNGNIFPHEFRTCSLSNLVLTIPSKLIGEGEKNHNQIKVCFHAVFVMHKRFKEYFTMQTNLSLPGELLKFALRVKAEEK